MSTMPSKKRKYNARFPAGRIKKIMQTDEEVGKVAQAVPVIIYLFWRTPRTLELFVESLLSKSMQVTLSRHAKTLSPSHVKQCILAESRFDFLKDLVKTIPDVSAAEEKELISAENSPNASRFSDTGPPRKILREDSTSSSGSDIKNQSTQTPNRIIPEEQPHRPTGKIETITSNTPVSSAIDLTRKLENEAIKTPKKPNFYQETLNLDDNAGVIKINPKYGPIPSTSAIITPPPLTEIGYPLQTKFITTYKPNSTYIQNVTQSQPKIAKPVMHIDLSTLNNNAPKQLTPLFNIDFSKNISKPEIKILDSPIANSVARPNLAATNNVARQDLSMANNVARQDLSMANNVARQDLSMANNVARQDLSMANSVARQNSTVSDVRVAALPQTSDDNLNCGDLEIDEDYDT